MKLDPSIIALKDFENIIDTQLKLARYSTAIKAPSINVSEQSMKPLLVHSQHDAQHFKSFKVRSQNKWQSA